MTAKEIFEPAYPMRLRMKNLLDELSIEQLNKIPQGLNNNIIWHIGHMIVSTEGLCYLRTGVNMEKEILHVDKYRNGTRPEAWVTKDEIDYLKERLFISLEEIADDYKKGLFNIVNPHVTMTFGVEMRDIETVFKYCCSHDILHAGAVSIMKKLV